MGSIFTPYCAANFEEIRIQDKCYFKLVLLCRSDTTFSLQNQYSNCAVTQMTPFYVSLSGHYKYLRVYRFLFIL